jgi:non-homologous end joining protein Ku
LRALAAELAALKVDILVAINRIAAVVAQREGRGIASTHVIEIDSFVPRGQIDQRFFDTPYYVTPNEPVGQEAFAVIREAMRGKGMVALGRLVLSKRERHRG